MNTQLHKRLLSLLLCCAMVLGSFPAVSFAAYEDGLCQHHPEHTEECGYGSDSPCTFDCQECAAEAANVETEAAASAEATEPTEVTEVTEPTEVTEATAVTEEAEPTQATEATEDTEPTETTEATEDTDPTETTEETEPTEATQADEETTPTEDEQVAAVWALIQALPTVEELEAMTEEELQAVNDQVLEAFTAYSQLSEEQKALIPEAEEIFAALLPHFTTSLDPALASSYGYCGDNLSFSITCGTLYIEGTGNMWNYYDRSAPWHDQAPNINTVIISDGVTSIGNYAFYGCKNLSYISIPDSLTSIGNSAFHSCTMLTSIRIPNSVTFIDDYAFAWCLGLTSVTLPSNLRTIRASLFYECRELTSITIPDSVTTIADYAFYHCTSLANATLPKNLYSIGEYAFNKCYTLTSITIPDSVSSIGKEAFRDCYCLATVTLPKKIQTIPANMFNGCDALTSVTIPDGVTTIAARAFLECSSLAAVTIPASITLIDVAAFSDCTGIKTVYYGGTKAQWAALNIGNYNSYLRNARLVTPEDINCGDNLTFTITGNGVLTISGSGAMWDFTEDTPPFWANSSGEIQSVVISEGVTSIGSYAFSQCTKLTSILIPDSVTSIGSYAFSQCGQLTSVSLPKNLNAIQEGVFHHCYHLDSITIPDSVTSIGHNAFYHCMNLASITIPNRVTSIGNAAFWGCDSLASISISDNVRSIGDYAFAYCEELTTILLPGLLSTIGEHAFFRCDSLKSITIPRNVTSIGKRAFDNCPSLTSVTIMNGVTSISSEAFYNCTNVTSITIPDSVTSIGDGAFYNCTNLASLTIPNQVTSIGTDAFCNCTNLTSLTIPNRVTSIGSGAFSNCTNLTSVALSEGITSINSDTFSSCTELTSITIPDGVTSIGSGAFSDCTKLASVSIPVSVTCISSDAFTNCQGLETVQYGGSMAQWKALDIGDNNECLLNAQIIAQPTADLLRGACGNNLTFALTSDGILTISGTGTMWDFRSGDYIDYSNIFSPWKDEADRIQSVVIMDGVCSIGTNAFRDCINLTSVTIPYGITEIRECAFYQCASLNKVYYGGSQAAWEDIDIQLCNDCLLNANPIFQPMDDLFCGKCGDNLIFTLDTDGVLTISGVGPMWRFRKPNSSESGISVPWGDETDRIQSVVIMDGVSSIGSYAFIGCSNLAAVTIPCCVERIGISAFSDCSGLKTVYYGGGQAMWEAISTESNNDCLLNAALIVQPTTDLLRGICGKNLTYVLDGEGVLSISGRGHMWDYDFPYIELWERSASAIQSVIIEEGVISIGEYAFRGCTNLTTVTILDGLTTIGFGAFIDCTNLTSITIPESVRIITSYAFYDCNRIEKVFYGGTQAQWDAISIGSYNGRLPRITPIFLPRFTAQPQDVTALLDANVSFTVEATGTGLTYQWEYRAAGTTTWKESPADGNKTDTLKLTATTDRKGMSYRCVVTDAYGNQVTSDVATLHVYQFKITKQPVDVTAEPGQDVTFTVKATGSNLTYQWQFRTAGTTAWKVSPAEGNQTATLKLSATTNRKGMSYRCIITDASGRKLTSDVATLYIDNFKITQQPTNVTANLGQNVTFTVKAIGTGLTYQWEYRSAGDTKWYTSPADGNKTDTLKLSATTNRKGMSYRCIITDASGKKLTSNAATLYINDFKITQQPVNVTANLGQNVSFTVKATGTGLTYQWEYRSAGDTKWYTSPADGNKTNTLKLSATTNRKGMSYRCIITDASGKALTSDIATLYINDFKITQQPTDVTADLGQNVTFTVKATGTSLTYQWEYRSAGDTKWYTSPADGNKTDTLKLTATTNRKGMSYRCIITDASGSKLTSNVATLTIK